MRTREEKTDRERWEYSSYYVTDEERKEEGGSEEFLSIFKCCTQVIKGALGADLDPSPQTTRRLFKDADMFKDTQQPQNSPLI